MLTLSSHIQELEAILTRHASEIGYSPEVLCYGFKRMFSHWNADEFSTLFKREIPNFSLENMGEMLKLSTPLERRKEILPYSCVQKLLLVTASTVPSASFQDMMISLMLPLKLSVRSAHSFIPLFGEFRDFLQKHAPLFAERLEIVDTGHDEEVLGKLIADHDAVNVSGSDETIHLYESLIEKLPKGQSPRLIRHGHRLSALAIYRDEINDLGEKDYESMSVDVSIWDQTGCLSPKCVFIECDRDNATEFGRKLIEACDKIGKALPELMPETRELAHRNTVLLMAELNGVTILRGKVNHDVMVIHGEGSEFEPILEPRILNIYPVKDANEAASRLKPYGQSFCTRKKLPEEVKCELTAYGYQYFCGYGEMQDPPIYWNHDGIGTLAPLIKR